MSFLTKIFASEKTLGKLTDGIYNGIDMAVYTSEEKAAMDQKVLDFRLKYMEGTKHQNVSRRYIAWGLVFLWCFLVLFAVLLRVCGADHDADFVFKVLNDVVNLPFGLVVGFYFGTHLLRGVKG